MAILSITVANVGPTTPSQQFRSVEAGETITHSQPVRKASDGTYYKTDANSFDNSSCDGIAMSGASTGGSFLLAENGQEINIGATLAVSTTYFNSATAGGIDVESALASGKFPTRLGYAKSASVFKVDIAKHGVAKP